MVLFKPPIHTINPFHKENVINEIVDMVQSKFPTYRVLKLPDAIFDLLIIRSSSYQVKKAIGQYEGLNEMILQQVFGISVTQEKDQEKIKDNGLTEHIITDNMRDVIRILEKE